ncbi:MULTISPECIES: PP2C family serine/threonine-protein phosphatase [unclassified Serratia (in: enterobacteria)]|uniref:PP2C family protein-serine/threonine phosphatase n=1 Tax=unclassified Serratia (in: enterobacteria) TaxID=2647522 RepID=UPI00050353BF|nr:MULTISPECIES: protein phosphatase 2C domain-containing protein [unclassified Serratia (in: enterobacteria)]KFK97903.1 PppA [Serratia sp. Ag2]KFL00294.1 PppA [Serratia sp. Ag1]
MNITVASTSNQGERVTNQDQIGEVVGLRAACFVVCDGIAGLPGGEIAAKVARDSILQNFDGERHLDAQSIRQYIAQANHAIRQQQQSEQYRKMGTTLVSLFIDRDYQLAYWAHAGDSRLYLFRRGYLQAVTRDHSLVQQMADAGYQTNGINSNLLYFALGMNEERDATYGEVLQLEDGDVFLLCTDGFWHNFTQDELEQSLHMVNSPSEWLSLMQQAWDKNGNVNNSDNYSAIAVWVGSPQETTLLHSLTDAERFLSYK